MTRLTVAGAPDVRRWRGPAPWPNAGLTGSDRVGSLGRSTGRRRLSRCANASGAGEKPPVPRRCLPCMRERRSTRGAMTPRQVPWPLPPCMPSWAYAGPRARPRDRWPATASGHPRLGRPLTRAPSPRAPPPWNTHRRKGPQTRRATSLAYRDCPSTGAAPGWNYAARALERACAGRLQPRPGGRETGTPRRQAH